MLKVYEQITGMKKEATKREAQKKEMADVIEQEKLTEVKGKLARHAISVESKTNSCRSTPVCPQKRVPSTSGRGKEDGR